MQNHIASNKDKTHITRVNLMHLFGP